MKFDRKYTLKEISAIIKCEYVGEDNFPVLGLNEIHRVQSGDIVFVDHPKYYDKALESDATIILINKKVECPKGKALIISDDPFRDINKLINYFLPFKVCNELISKSAEIAEGTIIQPNTFIGNNVKIGKNCRIHSNVSIYDNTEIGDNVIIHSGSVFGSDAFYYKKRENEYDKFNCGGKVIIEDNVEIGACTTIDKGVTYPTTIKKGCKLDNHIHVGHDTIIEENCLFAAHTAIAGCVTIEKNVTVWGKVAITSGVTIGENAIILGSSSVSKSLEGNKTYFGSPAIENKIILKQMVALRKLPNIIDKLKK